MSRGAWAVRLAALAAAVWLTAPAAYAAEASAAEPAPAPEIRYLVRPNDTLSQIAAAYLSRPEDYKAVAALNGVRRDRRLRPGRELRIPVALLKALPAEAVVANFRGEATIEQGGRRVPATVGLLLREGAVIATGPNAFIRLTLPDRGHVSLPSMSRVRITRLRVLALSGALVQQFDVEAGRTETEASPVQPNGGFTIRTPITTSAVRGTRFRVSYDAAAARTATEVISGQVEVATDAESRLVPPSQGVSAGADGLKQAQLLPAPALARPDAVLKDITVAFGLVPDPRAARYRARIATDAGMIDAILETDGAPGQPVVTFPALDDGVYFVRLTALSGAGVEGLESIYSFVRARAGLGGLSAGASGRGKARTYNFRWEAEGAGKPVFRFVLRAAEKKGAPPLLDLPGLNDPHLALTGLPSGVYEWTVLSTVTQFGKAIETWSEPRQLRVGK